MRKRLHFWKPLELPLLAKSRVIEIFHASKLFFAANFYPVPPEMVEEITNSFIDYITFPKNKKDEVSKREMEKLREYGGIKLINFKLKSETPKIHWLVKIITDPSLKIQLSIFESLIGTQIGELRPRDIIFAEKGYIKKCKLDNLFYKEAFEGIAKLDTWKHAPDINNEHLFYNPIFTTTIPDDMHDMTITPFQGNRALSGIKTYGDLIAAETTLEDPRMIAVVCKKKESIHHIRPNVQSNLIKGLNDRKEIKFKNLTQKIIYSELIHEQSTNHIYHEKWTLERDNFSMIDWDRVWDSIHEQFFTESVKSTVWEQIHLNFYTTHSYNTWHKNLQPCPLCRKIPENIFHILLDCKFTKVMWKRMEKVLIKIVPRLPTEQEMAFGLQPRNMKRRNPTILRNWITFSMRHQIMLEERKAYKRKWPLPFEKFFLKFNHITKQELQTKKLLYDFRGLSGKFKKIVTTGNAIATTSDGKLIWKDIL